MAILFNAAETRVELLAAPDVELPDGPWSVGAFVRVHALAASGQPSPIILSIDLTGSEESSLPYALRIFVTPAGVLRSQFRRDTGTTVSDIQSSSGYITANGQWRLFVFSNLGDGGRNRKLFHGLMGATISEVGAHTTGSADANSSPSGYRIGAQRLDGGYTNYWPSEGVEFADSFLIHQALSADAMNAMLAGASIEDALTGAEYADVISDYRFHTAADLDDRARETTAVVHGQVVSAAHPYAVDVSAEPFLLRHNPRTNKVIPVLSSPTVTDIGAACVRPRVTKGF